jgi:hypothetical protein
MGVDAYRKHDVFFFDVRREKVSPRPVASK